ncbi:MAG: hypothetical protein B6I24_05600 [Bacteroidetes bacterium 4572_128]|nr:MAG: hypothetical protein B6I24_05600 [Bacteroidetes bacterium 4572_128]
MKEKNSKFYLKCKKCSAEIQDFSVWFTNKQVCKCGSKQVNVFYYENIENIKKLISKEENPKNVFHYFDFLPLLDKKNIVSKGEGIIPLERWNFLENYAKEKFNIKIKVYAYRNDKNPATETFKDVAASVVASVLKENKIKNYSVASTGNIGTAFSSYLAEANISLNAFLPEDALKNNEAEMSIYGQRIFKVKGDYQKAKEIANEFSEKYNILLSGGNFDPMRIEAKKTMVFEWLRILGEVPNVYIQALSGGTGPFAIEKAHTDLEKTDLFKELPRFILVQPDKCDPMAQAYQKAKNNNFPKDFENDYPILKNPKTEIPTLATGNPATYPEMSKLVKKSNGDIISFEEEKIIDVGRLVAYETGITIGPAAAIAVGGFFKSLKENLIFENDKIIINIGEGVKRASKFMEEMIYTTKNISNIESCKPFNRENFKKILWDNL